MSGIVGTLHGSRESDVAVVGDRNVAAKKGIDALIVDWEEGRDIGANRIQSRSFDRQGSPEVHSAGRRKVIAADRMRLWEVSERGNNI